MLSVLGFFGLNGVFLFYAFLYPETMISALHNPIGLVFMLEAFVMVALGTWLITRLGLKRPGGLAFIVFSLLGSLAFSVPFFLLLHLRKRSASDPGAVKEEVQ